MSFLADIGIVERTAQKRKVGKPSDRRESSKSRFQLLLIWYCTYCNNVYTYICFFFVSGLSAQVYISVTDEKYIPPSNFNRSLPGSSQAAHYNGLFHRVEGLVSEWKREDEEGHEVKDAAGNF